MYSALLKRASRHPHDFKFQFCKRCFEWGEFMHGTLSGGAASASEINRTTVRASEQLFGTCLADVARLLWPDNTAAHVASASHCSQRAAEYYLAGQREWSGDAIAAIVAEILRRHSMRNVKVRAR